MTDVEPSPRPPDAVRIVQYAYCLAPLAALCVVFLLYAHVYNSLIACPDGTAGCTPIPEIREALQGLLSSMTLRSRGTALIAFPGRIFWAISIGLSLMFSLVVFCWATYLAAQARRYDKRSYWHNAWPPLVALAVWLSLSVQTSTGGAAGSPWRQFAHSALCKDFAAAQEWTRFLDNSGFFLAAYAAVALSIYLCASVPHRVRWQIDFERHAGLVNMTLYVGALLLVSGVFRIWALLYWSLDYVEPLQAQATEEQRLLLTALTRIADGIVSSRGLLYTMMLAALYVPAMLLLHHQIRQAVTNGDLSAEVERSWLQGFSFTDNLMRIAAILSPAISGPAADYLDLVR